MRIEPKQRSAASSEKDDLNSVEQDQKIEEERKVLDVVQIVLELFQRVVDGRSVAVLDLSPARDPRLDGKPLHVERDLLLKVLDELWPLRARSDEAHVPHEDVEELRELIQTCPPKKGSHTRHSRVALRGPYRPGLLLGVVAHGPKLVQDEDTAVLTGPGLAVQNRARRLELDGSGHQQHDGGGQDESAECQDDVEEALDDLRAGSLHETIRKDDPTRSQRGSENLTGSLLVKSGPVLDSDPTQAALQQGQGGKVPAAVHLGDHDQVRVKLFDDGRQVGCFSEKRVTLGDQSRGRRVVVDEPDDGKWPRADRRQLRENPGDWPRTDHEHADGHARQGLRPEPGPAPEEEADGGGHADLEEGPPAEPETRQGESDSGDEESG